MNDLSLYFHIPFCVRKCGYCAFYSLAGCGERLKARYTRALLKQLGALAGTTDAPLRSVYFGGGTPPVLGERNLTSLIGAVYKLFKLAPGCEITVEVNPGTVDYAFLKRLWLHGFNRVSIGVQSFIDSELQTAGRIHTREQALATIADCRRAGYTNFSCDLMFGIPGQTKQSFARSLNMLLMLRVPHLSAYSLQLESGTPFYENRDRLAFPSEDEEEAMYSLLCESAQYRGYRHYEISSFALDGYRAVHNSRYWERSDYFGLGAGAHSFMLGKRFQTPPDIDGYIAAADRDDPFAPTDFAAAEPVTAEEARSESVFLGLRTDRGAALTDIDASEALRLARAGFGRLTPDRFILNDRGMRVSNTIIGRLML